MTWSGGVEGDPLLRRSLGIVIAGSLPWAWFLLQDRLGVVTDVLAIVLPLGALATAVVSLVVAGVLRSPGPRASVRRRRARVAAVFALSKVRTRCSR